MIDQILANCQLTTQDHAIPTPTAVAIRAGRIWAVGSDAEILQLAGPSTRIINLRGRRVLPGFTDAHFHFQAWALGRRQLLLAGLSSRQAVQGPHWRTRRRDPARPVDHRPRLDNCRCRRGPRLLDRHDLDTAAPHHPVFLARSDLHLATVNTAALRLAGVVAGLPDPAASVIDHDGAGQPTGILRDHAMDLIDAVMPQPDAAQIDRGHPRRHRRGAPPGADRRP